MVIVKRPAPAKPPFWKAVNFGRIGKAIAIVLPVVAVALWLIAGPFVDRRAEQRQRETTRLARLWAQAALDYAHTTGGSWPDEAHWEDALLSRLHANSAALPALPDGQPRRWALNRALAGQPIAQGQPANAVLFYESGAMARNATGGLEALPPPTEQGILVIAFADGHVESISDRAALRQRNDSALRRSPRRP